tara:strand:- start:375 stop:578 length:204 start_codon:yes stop_codon:yes gene_type:complete
MKHLMIQSDFRKIQNDFYDQLGTAVNDYYRERIGIMIDNGLTPNDLKNDMIEDIRAQYDQWRLLQPF